MRTVIRHPFTDETIEVSGPCPIPMGAPISITHTFGQDPVACRIAREEWSVTAGADLVRTLYAEPIEDKPPAKPSPTGIPGSGKVRS